MAATRKQKICFSLALTAVAAIIILSLHSFQDLNYFEMAFLKNEFTGEVDRSKVYFGGRHFIGVGRGFKKFPRNVQILAFDLNIFNAEKLEVSLSGVILYTLNNDELKHLHDAYDLAYKPIIETKSLEAVKIAASKFTVKEYRLQRSHVSAELLANVKKVLQGPCCPKDNRSFPADPGCKKYETCSLADKGTFCIVKSFQLQVVGITQEQEIRYLRNVLEQEKLHTEQYKQQEKMERKITEQMKKKIANDANEVAQNAAARSAYVKAAAQASAVALREDARNSGLQLMYTSLNITNDTQKNSLHYMRTLVNHRNGSFYVGFSHLVAKEGNN